jgi:hypothetical protein
MCGSSTLKLSPFLAFLLALQIPKPAELYIKIPDRILNRWRGERSDDITILIVRATSVHAVTNFRAITNAAVFKNIDAFDEAQGKKTACAAQEPR